MAIEGPNIRPTGLVAGEDLSAAAAQFKFVKLSAAFTVVLCDGVTDDPIGVLQNRPKAGDAADVISIGQTKIQGDADLAVGDSIGTSGDGQAAKYTVADTTKQIVGRVIADNGAAGGLVTALINCASGRVLA